MKKSGLIIIFLVLSISSYSQTTLNLNLNTKVEKLTKTLNEGDYTLKMKGDFECEKYKLNITINKTFKEYPKIDVSQENKEKKICSYTPEYESFKLERNTEVEVTIYVIEKENPDKIFKKIKRIYTTIKTRKWITSFGISGVKLVKADTYRTIADGDKFIISKGGSQEQYKAIPVMMFSVLNLKNEKAWIPSGGFGIDLENVTAFAGISKAFAQNFIITGGIAMHKQLRLNSQYLKNQIVDQEIPFNELNTDYYRVNPFISITFHLNNNIFKK